MADPQDSINPFVELPTAPPTGRPSKASAKSAPRPSVDRSLASTTESHKVGWKRISTRQWVRQIRDYANQRFGKPTNILCKKCFVTSGYYPDMVKEEYYQRYVDKFPTGVKKSVVSVGVLGNKAADSSMTSFTSTSMMSSSSTVHSTSSAEFFAKKKKVDGAYAEQLKNQIRSTSSGVSLSGKSLHHTGSGASLGRSRQKKSKGEDMQSGKRLGSSESTTSTRSKSGRKGKMVATVDDSNLAE